MLRINLVNQYDDQDDRYAETIGKALRQAYKTIKMHGRKILSVILVTDEEIRRINREYRTTDSVTDVLSFDIAGGGCELGDVFIAVGRATEQAETYGHGLDRELGFLAVHGFLHCAGYDHQTPAEESKMFALQDDILEACGLRRK